ncbi:MAG: hypothetical protein MUF64_12620 [Polyangiaceae bacterium]|nr:hypothetical protein [Polyangiaceae bacterium]
MISWPRVCPALLLTGLAACRPESSTQQAPATSASPGRPAASPPSPVASASAPAPSPSAPDLPEPEIQAVRWLAGPPRALLSRARDVVVLDPVRRSSSVLNPGEGSVIFAAESPSGSLLALLTGSALHLFRLADGQKIGSLPCEGATSMENPYDRPVAFRKDDRLVAAVCGELRVFEVDGGRVVTSQRVAARQLAFHGDSGVLVANSGGYLRVLGGASFSPEGKALELEEGRGPLRSVLSPDGRFLALFPVTSSDEAPRFKALMLKTHPAAELGPLAPEETSQRGLDGAFSPDGAAFFLEKAGAWTKVIAPGAMKAKVRASTPTTSGYAPSVSADGGRAVLFAEPGSWVVDVKTGETVVKLPGRAYAPNRISPDGAFLVEPGDPGAIVRSAADGQELLRFGLQESPPVQGAPPALAPPSPAAGKLAQVSWMNDSTHLLAWGQGRGYLVDSKGGSFQEVGAGIRPLLGLRSGPSADLALVVGRRGVELRATADGKLLRQATVPLDGEEPSVALSVDRRRLAHVGEQVRVWELDGPRLLLARPSPLGTLWSAAFTPDDAALVLVNPASFALLEVATGKQIGPSHDTETGATFPCNVSPDGRWVGAGAEAGHVARVWSTYPFRHVIDLVNARDCQNHTAPFFSDDSRQATAWFHGQTMVFEAGSWKKTGARRLADPELRHGHMDRDERRVVLGPEEGKPARVVDLASGRQIAALEGMAAGNLALSPDGRAVAEVLDDAVVLRSASDGKISRRVPLPAPLALDAAQRLLGGLP